MTTNEIISAMQTGMCTCHNPPLPMHRESDDHEWGHDVDETYAEVFHVHEDTAARDCDGPIYTSRTYQITSLRWPEGATDWLNVTAHDFWDRLAGLSAPLHSACTVEVNEQVGGRLTMTWHRRTDEGYEGGELRGCDDPDCAHGEPSQRDVYAEQMGY